MNKQLALIALIFGVAGLARANDTAPGKQIFLDNKCQGCHSVEAAGITLEDPAPDDEDSAPDLSNVKATLKADFLHLYLTKKADIDGKKHQKRFRGEDAERGALIDWLLSLEPAATEPDKSAG